MMKRKLLITVATTAILMFAFTVTAMASTYFDTSDVGKGVIKVTCNTGAKMKVVIQKGNDKYTYDINSSGKQESFPLQLGNGAYKVSLMENTSGSSYKLLAAEDVTLNLSNPNAVYLNSVQSIDWKTSQQSVSKAVALTGSAKTAAEKAQVLWDYMVKNNQYDYNKLASLPSTYVPVPDVTLSQKTGICYDFSSLYAAMLRSEGIPAKLVKGYAPKNATGYHAWNEVYEGGKWIVVDTTYDLQVFPKGQSPAMAKASGDFQKVYQY